MRSLLKRFFTPVDIASLAFVRIAFGTIMLWEVWRYFDNDWIALYWIQPRFNFKYYGFSWIEPWPGQGMYWHFLVLALLAVCIMLGLWYRATTVLFFLGFTYVFLLEEARYLNHFYMVTLLSFLLIFIPSHRAFSVDAYLRPRLRKKTSPAWALWSVRGMVGLVYFYGGLAKLNFDWLQGEPVRMWLAERTYFPGIGMWFTEEWLVFLISYGGLLFDLLIVPFLLIKRTRPYAFGFVLFFHITNSILFTIGIFPWMMIALTTVFFDPGWPRSLVSKFFYKRESVENKGSELAFAPRETWGEMSLSNLFLMTGIGVFFLLQLLIPFRHLLYPGNVSWTEEGHRFAWHMKLRDKNGFGYFTVRDISEQTMLGIELQDYLTSWQIKKMLTRPDMIIQFSHFIASEIYQETGREVEVYATIWVSLNGRDQQLFVNPNVNLVAQPRPFLQPISWLLPLTEPLRTP